MRLMSTGAKAPPHYCTSRKQSGIYNEFLGGTFQHNNIITVAGHDNCTHRDLIINICKVFAKSPSISHLLSVMLSVIVLGVALPAPGMAQVGRVELHTFRSETLTDEQFLLGDKNGRPVTIAGVLRFPRQNDERYPVIVLVHGSGGVSSHVYDWAREFNAMGVAVFILDSFTGRGLYDVNNDQGRLGRLAMIVDVYHALDLLAQHQNIDPARIAVMGFSRGGQAALYASLKRFQKLHGSVSGHEFAAYLAFYPSCNTRYINDVDIVNKPVRIFHGNADNYNPIAPCRAYVERLGDNGKDVVLHEYDNAQHVFDYRRIARPVALPRAQSTRACVLEETGNGIIVNAQTGRRFTYYDPCVELGPTVAFNHNAYAGVRQTVRDFVRTLFNAHQGSIWKPWRQARSYRLTSML